MEVPTIPPLKSSHLINAIPFHQHCRVRNQVYAEEGPRQRQLAEGIRCLAFEIPWNNISLIVYEIEVRKYNIQRGVLYKLLYLPLKLIWHKDIVAADNIDQLTARQLKGTPDQLVEPVLFADILLIDISEPSVAEKIADDFLRIVR